MRVLVKWVRTEIYAWKKSKGNRAGQLLHLSASVNDSSSSKSNQATVARAISTVSPGT